MAEQTQTLSLVDSPQCRSDEVLLLPLCILLFSLLHYFVVMPMHRRFVCGPILASCPRATSVHSRQGNPGLSCFKIQTDLLKNICFSPDDPTTSLILKVELILLAFENKVLSGSKFKLMSTRLAGEWLS